MQNLNWKIENYMYIGVKWGKKVYIKNTFLRTASYHLWDITNIYIYIYIYKSKLLSTFKLLTEFVEEQVRKVDDNENSVFKHGLNSV